ncbi:hypothetical protein [Natronorubrum daqingense]|uniref:Uncharacterized protein n=1 Tax=Natronorubrum daqingense TaxID=588898 RepID=A0A1N7CXT6_9EURY|nr:hypothetical protein [Natronorubrum daqingense]APX97112.1 hypothetical protein BB347_11030 [Natronorubrum daqingense]SIR68422.1 hypothetical protein SAMN05421809_1940 [Natronorubrum daqingense]
MTTRRPVILLVFLAVLGLTMAPAAGGVVDSSVSTSPSIDNESAESPDTNVSTFMQSSAADAESEVDAGMYESKYESAEDDRDEVVHDRTDQLESQQESLEDEYETLQEETDSIDGEYQARMTQLTVQINALERSINQTEQQAAEAGVDDDRLGALQENASEMAGPEVAAFAQELAGPSGTPGGGSVADAGSSAESSDRGQAESTQSTDSGSPAEAPNGDE